jgi:hypothetical protein
MNGFTKDVLRYICLFLSPYDIIFRFLPVCKAFYKAFNEEGKKNFQWLFYQSLLMKNDFCRTCGVVNKASSDWELEKHARKWHNDKGRGNFIKQYARCKVCTRQISRRSKMCESCYDYSVFRYYKCQSCDVILWCPRNCFLF